MKQHEEDRSKQCQLFSGHDIWNLSEIGLSRFKGSSYEKNQFENSVELRKNKSVDALSSISKPPSNLQPERGISENGLILRADYKPTTNWK